MLSAGVAFSPTTCKIVQKRREIVQNVISEIAKMDNLWVTKVYFCPGMAAKRAANENDDENENYLRIINACAKDNSEFRIRTILIVAPSIK